MGGRFRARKILLTNQAEIAGEFLETQQGLKAKSVTVGSGTTCRGPIVAERVELGKSLLSFANWGASWAGQSIRIRAIGRMTNAEDVYGGEVVLGKNSRCGRIFARQGGGRRRLHRGAGRLHGGVPGGGEGPHLLHPSSGEGETPCRRSRSEVRSEMESESR